jgi:NAD(P)-dependent dehydrogenase (short-subunit alcohol dehydrogenase family)
MESMPARFTGKVALITGGGSGIGRAAALAFAREGATAVVAGRNPEALGETVAAIEADGGSAGAVTADVTRAQDIARLVETTVARHGGLDVAFNNAGVRGPLGPIADLEETAWSGVVAANLTSVWLSMKYEIAHMLEHGGGVIVNTASNIGAHMRVPGLGAYAATKAGVSALTRAAAREYIGDGIRINAISPGPSDTTMSFRPGETEAERAARLKAVLPIGRVGALEEVTATVLWLASPDSGFAVGHDLVVDGGASA